MSTQHPYARPHYPHLQSTSSSQASSAYQSYSSTSSLSSPSPVSSAPLPSPSAATAQRSDFFGSYNRPQQQQQAYGQRQSQSSQRYTGYDYQPNREGAGRTAAETSSYLSQAALLAEAAKRAQMAVVMRDLDSMEL